MLTATEFIPLTNQLLIVLWVEVIIYLGTGLYKICDDFYRKTPSWVFVDDRLNLYAWYIDIKGNKSNAALAMLLGLVALNALLEGKINRFELEYMFVTLAMLNAMIFSLIPPGRRMIAGMFIAPEVYLQIAAFVWFRDLIRPEVLGLCILINLWGLFVLCRRFSKVDDGNYNWKRLNQDKAAAKEGGRVKPFGETTDSEGNRSLGVGDV
ncbi:hypothetical protein HBA55_22625 [Pseudomaricurvus alkylphenolicus]|uniref:hypothetical protein n=1 Tax=Pseudomaricurvus alkylphenolicus TaxID=1306991 RepID=UPI00142224C3|nr:hypothetical protein [Pseudomaricurvus alkylphenolicus]NIB42419.1 hypothetical protein [Pseudomaricurvus alkylphenolicus]